MALTLELPRDLEERLKSVAEAKGIPPTECAFQILNQHLPPKARSTKLRAMFEAWAKDEAENPEDDDGYDILEMLDEDRLSDRKLYPPELKGISW